MKNIVDIRYKYYHLLNHKKTPQTFHPQHIELDNQSLLLLSHDRRFVLDSYNSNTVVF